MLGVGGSAESERPRLTIGLTVKLFSQNFKLCGDDTSTSRTDEPTVDMID